MSLSMFQLLSLFCFFLLHPQILAQTTTSSKSGGSVSTTLSNSATLTPNPAFSSSNPPDVYLNVPTLSVGRIELDVDDLRADINLNAQVASLVTLNAGVALSIQEVNLTISDVDAELELIVRLGHLVDIVNRVFESLDLNPLLISAINNVTSLLEPIVGAVDGLLGSITQGGTTLSFLIDNLGNIVQEVNGVSTIVGNYLTNMTDTGVSQTLSGGLVEKTYSYAPLNALVDIVFNAAGQVVQASVQKQSGSGSGATTSSTPASSTTPTPSSSTSS
ncbi:uncharacterized protein Z519_08442 [Cladophialophora bantiana CBS 173.52]|uniref:Uncharacterized protein n=1 Tax=Cladophialophora bantiana (strain ATCC 10958 / CBS 173.52 / CDC B-1940 / NIH 8579) TaxID=1442370 RepID=A0A0D2I194_CLAB1|nr:uncharacterized protein Z519_08442 [Cladophialophora bantiana CBS 173.52]KIW90659.1 hypothetical protein Z519_08442 [Cladophialophora bantiana CBS 173.52]